MSDLSEFVESLKREVAVPGTFAANFPTTTDDDLTGQLADAFAEAQLDGFFSTYDMDQNAVVTPDLSNAGQALVVIYAGIRFITTRMANLKSHTRYEASGAVFEQDNAASVLVQILKDLKDKKTRLVTLASAGGAGKEFVIVDGYYVKAVDFYPEEVYNPFGYEPYVGI